MERSIFSNLFSYRATPDMKPEENYLTEMLAWMVDSLPQFGHDYVRFLCEKSKDLHLQNTEDFAICCDTQVSVKKGFIDMVISTDTGIGFICEHKVNSVLRDHQLQDYRDCESEVATRYQDISGDAIKYHIALVTKSRDQHAQNPDVSLIWHDIYTYFYYRVNDYDAYERMMIEQFLLYLTEVGMGMKENINIQSVTNYCEVMKLPSILKALFSELKDEVDWKKKCEGIETFVSDYFVGVPKIRWERVGLEFSKTWEPSIFAGVMLENNDHKLSYFNNEPNLVILVDQDINKPIFNDHTAFENIFNHQKEIEQETGFKMETKPINQWRVLILEKPLSKVLENAGTYEQQKESIKEEIIKGINAILQYYK